MSQDMMQALSGSSLLSLSVGTLPASKGGMNLDANPFASQLALMTGTDAAASGMAVPVAVVQGTDEGAFAATLDDMAGPAGDTVSAGDVAVPALPQTARLPATPEAPIVAALPEEASTLQLIEAALTGAATINQDTRAPQMAALPEQEAALTVQPLPHAANVPHLRNLIRADAAMPVRVTLNGETDTADAEPVSPDAANPRIRLRGEDTALPVEVPVAPSAPVIIAPLPSPAQRPDAPVTDLGSTRILAEAAPEASRPAAPAPIVAAPSRTVAPAVPNLSPADDKSLQVDGAPAFETAPMPAEAGQARKTREVETTAEPTLPATTMASPAVPAAPAPVVAEASDARTPAAPVSPTMPRAQNLSSSAQNADSKGTSAPMDSAKVVDPSTFAEAGPVAQPASPLPLNENRAQAAVQPPARAEVLQQPASTEAGDAAEAAIGVMTSATRSQTVTPGARTSTPAASRAPISATARRTIDTAIQSPRPAEALSTLFDLADPTLQPAASSLNVEQGVGLSIDAVPPAWAAALNAVNSQVQQPGNVAAAQATGPAQVPLHSLAFDAGFVAGIESQIAKLADGGQMVKIQVMPEHLGRIDIEMLAGPDRDQVRIVTEHDAVRDTLINSQQRLEQDLRNSGQRNTEVTVELRQQSPGTQNGSAQQQQRGQSGAESAPAREAAQRQAPADTAADAAPVQRRPRGNVRYA
ncbi:flagellar hook-length control protein FliK [Blastomonas natatoria]|uniref:Flagellar hook-length control protein FliK n=1 Tax=Blastomonas natatoria TaxID=34015 RepID=A0A2V3V8H9_9SPHN|nr:flagellar hook-length control protein FliK [Blastomonas natatoria]PXW78086.1 flagellar hook-length control protein FliK [Blastomonas natatoria]